MIEIPYALKEGVLTHVSEVEKGLDCGCVCVCCNNPVIARQGTCNEWHFAHIKYSRCRLAGETLLHIMAKEAIKDAAYIVLPQVSLRIYPSELVIFEKKAVFFDKIKLEQKVKTVKPDIIIYKNNRPLAVEIAYSHFCDLKKRERIEELGLSTIEVNLNFLTKKAIFNEGNIKKFTVEDTSCKKWIYNNRLEKIKADIRKIGEVLNTTQKTIKRDGGREKHTYFVKCPQKNILHQAELKNCRRCPFALSFESKVFCTFRSGKDSRTAIKQVVLESNIDRQRLNSRLFDDIVK